MSKASRARHLVRRFTGSLWPGGPRHADTAWAESSLLEGEVALWRQMAGPDRRHAVGVARRVQRMLGDEVSRPTLAAALLHDVGKTIPGLGTYGRVLATASGGAIGRDPETIKDWTRTRGLTRRVGLYLQHPRLGGDLLAMAGSDPLTEAWAREHELAEEEWTVPLSVGRALRAADDD